MMEEAPACDEAALTFSPVSTNIGIVSLVRANWAKSLAS